MATYTDNYQLTKPTYAEQADIGVVNSNMNKIDEVMHSSQISLAPAYDSTQTYTEGDVVMYELLMYKCISPTTGVWDASKWERTTASESGGGGSAELDILGEGNGAVVSFSDGASAELAKCIAEIVPKQDLHGYDKPWAGGAGKNKLEVTATTQTVSGVTFTVNNDGTIKVSGTNTSGGNISIIIGNVTLSQGTYTISTGNPTGASNDTHFLNIDPRETGSPYNENIYSSYTFTDSATTTHTIKIYVRAGITVNVLYKPMVESGSTATTYEPYSNICPIGSSTSVTVTVSDGETSTTKTTPLGQTVYGGQLNVLTGELTIDKAIITLDGSESWNDNPTINGFTLYNKLYVTSSRAHGISDRFKIITEYGSTEMGLMLGLANKHIYASHITDNMSGISSVSDWKTWLSNNNVNIVCEITPQTVQLTPQEVNSLLGQNNISADTGDIDIVYVKASAPIQPNPTGEPTAILTKLGIEGTVFEVPSGGGGSSSGINYSTTEQVIGTWIDGKPLYTKTFHAQNVTSSASVVDASFLENNYQLVGYETNRIKMGGTYNGTVFVPSSISSTAALRVYINSNGLQCNIEGLGSGLYADDVYFTIRYTKITD